jgi:hypothetical protein
MKTHTNNGTSFLASHVVPDPEIIEQIGELLDTLHIHGRKDSCCLHCGSPLKRVHAIFFLLESDRTWNVPLPICSRCDLKELSTKRAA